MKKTNWIGFFFTYGIIIIAAIWTLIDSYTFGAMPKTITESTITKAYDYSTKLGSNTAVEYSFYVDTIQYVSSESCPISWNLYKGKKVKIVYRNYNPNRCKIIKPDK